MKKADKRRHLRIHLERWVDRARWPDYVMTERDIDAYIAHESTGVGSKPEPLAWVKATEEITINQMWAEMAEMWSMNYGWFYPLHHTICCEWRERGGSNIWLRKLITIARSIKRHGFMEAMLRYTGFSDEQKNRYLEIKFNR